jgi:uncharacterized peroxidase-related enzyme
MNERNAMTAERTTFPAASENVACSPDSGGWIATVAPEEATGLLAKAYDHQREVLGRVTGITRLGSLYPELVAERLRLYDVVEATPSHIPEWARRAVILTVTILNGCDFCTASNSEKLAAAGRAELALSIARDPIGSTSGDAAVDVLLAYARRLTLEPAAVEESDVAALRQAGWDDMDILDLNNLVAYYAYVNRITSGLGLGAGEGPR